MDGRDGCEDMRSETRDGSIAERLCRRIRGEDGGKATTADLGEDGGVVRSASASGSDASGD